MSDCRSLRERLAPYVDGQLDAAQHAGVQAHLAGCPPCQAIEALERGGRALLQARGASLGAMPLPPGLRTRCEALARPAAATAQMPWRSRLVPLSFAVVLMVFTGSAFISLATHRSDGLMAAQLSQDHAWCFKRFGGASTASAEEMEQMFADRYGWRVRVPPSNPAAGVQLIGARRCYIDGRSVPHILYRVNGEEMSLYVLGGEARPRADLVAAGRRSRVWSRADTSFALVSPEPARGLTVAASYVMQAAQ